MASAVQNTPSKTLALANDEPHAVHVPEPMVNHIAENCPMSVHAMRLVYGLLFHGRSQGAGVLDTLRGLHAVNRPYATVPRALISRHVAAPGAKDGRWMVGAAEQLRQTALFSHLKTSGRVLEVKTTRSFVQKAPATEKEIKTTPFARLAPADLMHRSPYMCTAMILTRLHANKHWPKFRLPKIAADPVETACVEKPGTIPGLNGSFEKRVAIEAARRELLDIEPWRKTRAPWLKAFEAVASATGFGFLIAPVYDPWADHVRAVEVKIAHELTRWQPGTLYAAPASARSLYLVTVRGVRTVPREGWTKLSGMTRIE